MNKQAEEAVNKVLYRNVLEIMEQLEKSCDQIKALPIDNAKRLQGIVDLIYNKAADEPNFSKTAAFMTLQLAGINVSANDPENTHKTYNFLEFIIEKCQMEFKKNWKDNKPLYKQMKYIANEFIDPTIIRDLDNLIEKQERKFKTKALGNIRFIGELFKHSKLTPMSMVLYMLELLKNEDDDRLECLCELLKAVGEKLENTLNISYFFIKMQEIMDKESTNISCYVRELLQDVIDLRNSNWLPRKQDVNSKKMEQTQKDADTDQLNIRVMNSGSITTPQEDDRIGGDGGLSTDGFRGRAAGTIESQKLLNIPAPINALTLGAKSLFDQWGSGSILKSRIMSPIVDGMVPVFEQLSLEQDKARVFYDPRVIRAPSLSKGHNTGRSSYNQHNYYNDGKNSRSSSQHRNTPTSEYQQSQQQTLVQLSTTIAPAPVSSDMVLFSPAKLKIRMKYIMDEYLNDCCSLEDSVSNIHARFLPFNMREFIVKMYNEVLKRSDSICLKAAKNLRAWLQRIFFQST